MTDISIQLHALPEELVPLVKRWAKDFELHVVTIRFFPFRVAEIEPAALDEVLDDPTVRRVALTVGPPSLSVESGSQFADQNPDKLQIDIGRITEKGLGESWLTARTENAGALAVWKQAAKQLKAITKAGATAINPATQETSRLRNHRFTEGARALEQAGTIMRPAAGTSVLKLS